jgi:hypothetical protein
MSIPTQYLSQGLTGNLGKYQVDANSLEQLGFLKAGTVNKAESAAAAINSAANWTGANGINSAADFLTNPAVQEKVIEQLFEKNYETLTKTIPGFSKLTDSEQAGLLQIAHLSGLGGVKTLMNDFGGKVPNIPGLLGGLAVSPADIAGQPSSSYFFGMLHQRFLPTQIQALAAQTAKIASKLPVSVPAPLGKFVRPAGALGGAMDKLPGLNNLPGGVQVLTSGTGGLKNTLGGIVGVASKLPGGLSNVPGNLSSVAGKIPSTVTDNVGGLAGGLNKISQVAGKLPGTLNDVSGVVPTKLTQLASAAVKAPALIDQYRVGFNASELGKKIAKV